MAEFFNTYHFVPVKSGGRLKDIDKDQLGSAPHARHDKYVAGAKSGRIVCRLETVTPTVCGGTRENGAPARVEPFRLQGEPAIAATSLKGVITSVAEAASNSALRVLENRTFSYRRQMPESLSAIGMVVLTKQGSETRRRLIPLAYPTVQAKRNSDMILPPEYMQLFGTRVAIKAYVGNRNDILRDAFPYRTFRYGHRLHGRVFGMKLANSALSANGVIARQDSYRIKEQGQSEYLIAQLSTDQSAPRLWMEIPEGERHNYTPGIMRVLGCWGADRSSIPNTKKHELFIPIPAAMVDADGKFQIPLQALSPVEIPPEVLKNFEDLADERFDARRDGDPAVPFAPKDTRDKAEQLRLKTGDLIYFKAEMSQGKARISEISFSSIWRGKTDGTAFQFFQKVDEELIPFNNTRTKITPAEQLFGFAEDSGVKDDADEHQSLALAGRVRFSAARLDSTCADPDSVLDPEVTLKIQAAPKLPSPSMYFRKHQGEGHIAKKDLNLDTGRPQGRKFYLHHRAQDVAKEPWRTRITRDVGDFKANLEQKAAVRPIRAGTVFWFHLDFDNLSEYELGMLVYALNPAAEFQHKIGLGKALGLGSVRIDIAGLFLVDRQRRYTAEGFDAPRYHTVNRSSAGTEFPPYYGQEWGAAVSGALDLDVLRKPFRSKMKDATIHEAIGILGDPTSTARNQVQPPLNQSQSANVDSPDREHETFKWFVNNEKEKDDSKRQYLKPLDGSPTQMRLVPLRTQSG